MEIFFIIYGVLNLFGMLTISFCFLSELDTNPYDYLIFPALWRWTREKCNLNIAGAIIVNAVFGLVLLPAILALYIFGVSIILCAIFWYFFISCFKKRDRKRNKKKGCADIYDISEEDEKDFEEFCKDHVCEKCEYFKEEKCMEAFVRDKYYLN